MVCLARLKTESEACPDNSIPLQITFGPNINAGDWISDATFLSNSFSDAPFACLVTAHNAILGLCVKQPDTGRPHEYHITRLGRGPDSVLYSAHILPLSSRSALVAAGTVLGEIVVWSCHSSPSGDSRDWLGAVHHVFTGHKGSVFGVHISDELQFSQARKRLLASCSDDRTIRIWDLESPLSANGSGKVVSMPRRDQALDTASGIRSRQDDGPQITMSWGHLSRIWGVMFVNGTTIGASDMYGLVSRGEDATCNLWELGLHGLQSKSGATEGSLARADGDHHHSGKSIWSMAYVKRAGRLLVFTGGADGGIVSRAFEQASPRSLTGRNPTLFMTFQDVFKSIGSLKSNASGSSGITLHALKQYLFVSHSSLLATTDTGHLLGASLLETDKISSMDQIEWKVVHHAENIRLQCVLSCNSLDSMALIGDSNGNLFVLFDTNHQTIRHVTRLQSNISWIYIAGKRAESGTSSTEYCIIVSSIGMSVIQLLWLTKATFSPELKRRILQLPPTFTPTSALLLRTGVLALGSRTGAVAVYCNENESLLQLMPACCIRNVHVSDTVTSISQITSSGGTLKPNESVDLILTTGRDGTYAIHKVISELQIDNGSRLRFETISVCSLPFGPYVEGAYFSTPTRDYPNRDLVLYGFRSKEFVVWNETRQTQIFAVDCGGAHRSWAYSSFDTALTEKCPMGSGLFVWTKASSFNLLEKLEADHEIIQPGGHGREIKALAVSTQSWDDIRDGIRDGIRRAKLIATGAEDTMIRFYTLHENPKGSGLGRDELECIRTLKKHTTGIQHLMFSRCGRYLFSSAGCEELNVWRIRSSIPSVGVGALLESSFPKEENNSDLRITHFDLAQEETASRDGDGATMSFAIFAVYSNSMIKCFQYTAAGEGIKGSCEILRRVHYQTNCLTQINLLPRPALGQSILSGNATDMLTASTDGHITLWPAREGSEQSSDVQGPSFMSHRIHQNSIKAIEVVPLEAETVFVISGGDDNALGLTLVLKGNHIEGSSKRKTSFSTLLLPNAHAAAVTAICLVAVYRTDSEIGVRFLSTGNDQRLRLWHVTVLLDRILMDNSTGGEAMEAVQVEKLGEAWTIIADVGAMELVPPATTSKATSGEDAVGQDGVRVLVVGVGMEVLHIAFPGSVSEAS